MWNNEIIVIKEGQFITGRKKLSDETGINESTIEKILKIFEKEHQIEQQKTNKFRLITVINWKDYQEKEHQNNIKVTSKEHQNNTNKNDKKNKNDKNINTSDLAIAGVNEIMNIFYKINPALNFQNKTSRSACEWLIKKYKKENVIRMAEAVVAVQGKPYAPVATTPYQMKEKLAQFKIYFDNQKNNKSNFVQL